MLPKYWETVIDNTALIDITVSITQHHKNTHESSAVICSKGDQEECPEERSNWGQPTLATNTHDSQSTEFKKPLKWNMIEGGRLKWISINVEEGINEEGRHFLRF
jgi:hypothetical protein